MEVLAQACAAAAGGAAPAVHVNMTAPSAGAVVDVLEVTGLDPSRLVIELSERSLADASPSELARLRGLGVRVAFDDFGTGHEALQLLRERRLDMIKLARPFVATDDRAVLALLLQLGRMFEVEVVAEGIERDDQREGLAELGFSLGQGYLLGRPVPLAASTVA
jgi:EAL domain-containing protein (putative c-di-GMP-specific phosphodiesterase class I)